MVTKAEQKSKMIEHQLKMNKLLREQTHAATERLESMIVEARSLKHATPVEGTVVLQAKMVSLSSEEDRICKTLATLRKVERKMQQQINVTNIEHSAQGNRLAHEASTLDEQIKELESEVQLVTKEIDLQKLFFHSPTYQIEGEYKQQAYSLEEELRVAKLTLREAKEEHRKQLSQDGGKLSKATTELRGCEETEMKLAKALKNYKAVDQDIMSIKEAVRRNEIIINGVQWKKEKLAEERIRKEKDTLLFKQNAVQRANSILKQTMITHAEETMKKMENINHLARQGEKRARAIQQNNEQLTRLKITLMKQIKQAKQLPLR